MKADFLLSLCELVVGGKDGLQPIEKTVIDRCVRLVYQMCIRDSSMTLPPALRAGTNIFPAFAATPC